MPSSLATVLSLTSGFSPCPPVSVLVRAAYALPEAFPGSRHHVLRYFPKISLTCHALALWLPDLPGNQPLRFALNPLRGSHYPSPSLLRSIYGCRNLSPAFHPLRLSASRWVPTYPGRTNLPLESLGFRCVGFSPTSRYSHRHSHFYTIHRSSRYGFCSYTTLPYHYSFLQSAVSVSGLAPVHFRRRVTRLVSCYALFKGWLLLSQPPSCLGIPTSFST